MTDSSLDIEKSEPLPEEPAEQPATQPEPSGAAPSLTLEPPKPVAAVPARDAMDAVKLDPAEAKNLDEKVTAYLDAVTSLDTHDPAFTARVNDITKLGDNDIRSASNVSNRLLDKPMAAMKEGGVSQAGHITKSLSSLRRTVEDLDPQRQGDLLSPRKLFGVIPRGDRVVEYFRK